MPPRKKARSANREIPQRVSAEGGIARWEEDVMSPGKKPLKPDDFPVNAEGKKIKKQDGTPVADTEDPAVATDVAERLNEDENFRREQDKWSA